MFVGIRSKATLKKTRPKKYDWSKLKKIIYNLNINNIMPLVYVQVSYLRNLNIAIALTTNLV